MIQRTPRPIRNMLKILIKDRRKLRAPNPATSVAAPEGKDKVVNVISIE